MQNNKHIKYLWSKNKLNNLACCSEKVRMKTLIASELELSFKTTPLRAIKYCTLSNDQLWLNSFTVCLCFMFVPCAKFTTEIQWFCCLILWKLDGRLIDEIPKMANFYIKMGGWLIQRVTVYMAKYCNVK